MISLTDQIEVAWKHEKDYFKYKSWNKLSQFDGHLVEVMWREVYTKFFDLVKSVYHLDGPREFSHPTALFNSNINHLLVDWCSILLHQ